MDYAVRHVLMRQGVLGVKVKIMLPYDPTVRFITLKATTIWPPRVVGPP